MTLRQLRYFLAIVDEGSFLKASKVLCIAQPALSSHIVHLEDELGVQLLIRSPRGVTATAAGEILYMHAQKIQAQIKQAQADVTHESQTPQGEVALALAPMLASHLAPLLVRKTDELYPDVTLRIIEARSLKAYDLVETGRVDLAILAKEKTSNSLSLIELFEEPLYLVEHLAPGEEPNTKEISFKDMTATPLILSHKSHAVRALLEREAEKKKLPLNIKVEAESSNLHRSYIRSGIAAAVFPWPSLHRMWESNEISARKIVKPDLRRTICLAWPKQYPLTPATEVVRELVFSFIKELHANGVIHGDWLADELP